MSIFEHGIETREPQPHAACKQQHRQPAEPFQSAKPPGEQHDRRRNAEVDEVGEAVEFGAKARLRLERPCQPPIDAVEQACDDDQRDRQLIAALDRHADRGDAGAETEQREEVRHQQAHRHLALAKEQPAAAPHRSGPEWLVIVDQCDQPS